MLWCKAHFEVKMYKTHHVRNTLEVAMSKKCTPLWREAHFEVKMHKAPQLRSTLIEVATSKKCTPLWREAHFEVKMYKAPQLRNTLRSCDVEKVHAVVARNTFRSQNVQNTPCSEHFGSCDVEKVHAVVARSTFRSQNVKSTTCSRYFWTFRFRFAWQAQGNVDLVKEWAKREGFVTCPKTLAGVGHLKRICKDASSMAGAVQETCWSGC